MNYDSILKYGKSKIQFGHLSDRIYLMKLHKDDFPEIIDNISNLACENGFSKIFFKSPDWAKAALLNNGYRIEAHIPGFYNSVRDVFFMSKFLSSQRETIAEEEKIKIDSNLELAMKKANSKKKLNIAPYVVKRLSFENVNELTTLYKTVFETYPFPIFEPDYILNTMESNIAYFGVFHNNELISASSAECDFDESNVEMTDFATRPSSLGKGLAYALLMEMEHYARENGLKTFYTIARSLSAGMNITFSKAGYAFSGTLINNTNIYGRIESMNVWHKNAFSDTSIDN